MTTIKKIATALLSILLLILFTNFVLNIWVAVKFKSLLKNNSTSYSIKYNKMDLSLLSRSVAINEITLLPKNNSDSIKKTTLSAEIESIKVTNIALLGILFDNKIKANNLIVSSPKINILLSKKSDKKERNEAVKSLRKIFQLSSLYIKNATVKIAKENTDNVFLKAHNLNVNLNKIALSNFTIDEEIPFSFKNYSIKCDSIYYHPNEFYNIKSDKIIASDSELKISNFKYIPLYSRKKFVSKLTAEKDLYAISSKEIRIKDMNWGFTDSIFFFESKSVLLDKVSASIYRSKEPKDDLTKKKLYNSLLRELKFNLKVDTLKVRNSFLIYEEEITFEKGPGKLFFDNFNLTATNIESGFNKTKLPDLKIKVACNFMKTSPLLVNWKLNVLDKTDGFRIMGNISNLNLEKLNPFTKPYINVKTEGNFDKVVFDITGNDTSSKGKFAIEYDDLKVTVFKKENRKKKNKLLSAIGNLFVKNDTKDKLKSVDVNVDRVQETSFYNFLWLNIAQGLKKILI